MQTHREIEFGDGVYRFRLGMGQIIEVEQKLGARIGAIHRHLLAGRYSNNGVDFGYSLEGDYGADELMTICHQALVGGNYGYVDGRDITVPAHVATRLVRTYLHPENGNPLIQAWDLATAVVQACVIGFDPDGEAEKKSPKPPRTKRKDDTAAARSSATAG